MHYVLFRHTAAPDQQATSDQYYEIARNMEGFIDETSFVDPQNPGVQFLLARFADEQAVLAWRNSQMRLGMMSNARKNILRDFRLTVGRDEPVPDGQGWGDERVIVVYRRPAADRLGSEYAQLAYVVDGYVVNGEGWPALVAAEEFYTGEKTWIWVAMLEKGADPYQYERYLKRIPGDAVWRIYVEREYGKTNRQQAPQGIDQAEAKAVAEAIDKAVRRDRAAS